jgi:nitric oxide reductase large subunit
MVAFWLYNVGLVLGIALNFFPIRWPQFDAVFEHGLALRAVSSSIAERWCGSGCVCQAILDSW